MIERLPKLKEYVRAWPVDDALRMRLKYTSLCARKQASRNLPGDVRGVKIEASTSAAKSKSRTKPVPKASTSKKGSRAWWATL